MEFRRHEVLGRSPDELPPQTGRLLLLADTMVTGERARLRVIQEMPGHAKLMMTEIYTLVSIILLRHVYGPRIRGECERCAGVAGGAGS